ncbi:MAG: hypothetical protein JWN54_1551 [Mycobacterium sp.]|nr:hypothetical protein [Mycobacterium sp.]
MQCPTMGVWSNGDMVLTEEQLTRSGRYVDAPWRYAGPDALLVGFPA